MKHLKINTKERYAIVQMNRGKVNALNHDMVLELRSTFARMEKDPAVQGVVLTGQPHYFSAGLDLIELMTYNEAQIQEFFRDFGALYLQLVQFGKPFVSAITGHAPAGGCVLAVTSDNRYMAAGDKYVIGLNEVAVNIQISQNLTEIYAFWMGLGRASRYLLEGRLLSGKEAMAAGLVDELLPLEEVLPRAEKQLRHHLTADPEIWRNTKAKVRKSLWEKLDTDSENVLKEAAALWWKPEIRKKMEAYVAHFTRKK
ncbi:enoyl-CoA hydratase/isomerase family protein [Maribacter sp. 2307ULW6-5]|uniref:enoyl-CoA hydratase/isomerase family protein n=1 Tax=Maribacter sp. 2307ULW6-5 TaxID=3386275 RepID=UPI0039BC6D45